MSTDTRTPEEIERDIERERAALSSTVNELQDRLSPEYLIGQVTQSFREHGGDISHAISRSVKQNPVALALTGAGLAWMMFGRSWTEGDGRRSVSHSSRTYSDNIDGGNVRRLPPPSAYRAYDDARDYRGTAETPVWARDDDHDGRGFGDRASSLASRVGDGLNATGKGVSDAASATGSTVSSAAGSVRDAVSGAASSVASGARSLADGASHAAGSAAESARRTRDRLAHGTQDLSEAARERVIEARARAVDMQRRASASMSRNYAAGRDAAVDFYDEQPLVAGALAIAVGAALAGALPRTRREDEAFGETRDELFREAERIFREESEKAKRVANAALDEAGKVVKEERDRMDDSAPGQKSAAEAAKDKVESAAARVASAAEGEAERQKLGQPGE